ncbi:MAG TPA: shikimate kinase [Marinobacter sp.]|uniref:Shikimate kinase n=2 Tax=root TaxID=1 RepID=A0A831VVU6_9GAMM|nr:shikimate kinase [Marinobacter antarcticus]HDZ37823.1 shikimate kinase [Marinobacter sp.]HEA53293.1 shikimate kinase [Marinobacter antarcticus]
MPLSLSNVVLIGMPGSGKSTVGVLLAKAAALAFVDTDLLIQSHTGKSLQSIVDDSGYQALRRIEESVLCNLDLSGHVIATGGSAVYGDPAMQHLKRSSVIVFLDISLATVRQRIGDFSLRGVSKHPDQTLEELFAERRVLYTRYADRVVQGDHKTQDQVCEEIRGKIHEEVFREGNQE